MKVAQAGTLVLESPQQLPLVNQVTLLVWSSTEGADSGLWVSAMGTVAKGVSTPRPWGTSAGPHHAGRREGEGGSECCSPPEVVRQQTQILPTLGSALKLGSG